MATGSPDVFADFRGGVNLQAGPYLIGSSQARDARNIHGASSGAIRKRPGFVKASASALDTAILDGPPHSLFAVNKAPRSLVLVGKSQGLGTDSIIKLDPVGAPTVLKNGLTLGRRWSFVQGPAVGGQGPIYGLNGVDTPVYWDGTSSSTGDWTATIGSVPQGCRFLAYHFDVLWAAGDAGNPSRIQSCGLTTGGTPVPDPRNWSTDYMDQVEPNDGAPITALGTCGPYLLVAKARKLYALADFSSRNYRKISSEIGCIAHRSMVETSAGTMFLSEDLGVCVTDGTNVTPISDNVLPLIQAVSQQALANAAGAYRNGSYFLSIPDNGANNELTLEYEVDAQAWWIHTCGSNQFAILESSSATELYSACPDNKQVDRAFVEGVYGDYGDPYAETYWESPFLAWGNPHVNKRVRQFRVDGRGEWDLYSKETFEDNDTLLEGFIAEEGPSSGLLFGGAGDFGGALDVFGPAGGVTQRRYPTPSRGWGRAWSLTLRNYDTNPMDVFSLGAFIFHRSD